MKAVSAGSEVKAGQLDRNREAGGVDQPGQGIGKQDRSRQHAHAVRIGQVTFFDAHGLNSTQNREMRRRFFEDREYWLVFQAISA
jgi:hypothetical protein